MYDTMQREVYYPHWAHLVYTTVSDWRKLACNRANTMQRRQLELLLASSQLGFVTMDILGPLLKATSGN